MRKIIVSEFLTLDGVMEAPDKWQFPFWNDETGKFKLDELFASDALLLGRVTYQEFAEAWPSMTDEEGFADRMNSLPKYVVSTTLKEPNLKWNNSRLIKGDIAREISKPRQQPVTRMSTSSAARMSLSSAYVQDCWTKCGFTSCLSCSVKVLVCSTIWALSQSNWKRRV